MWCLRDDGNILFNFGINKEHADQALAVVRKYGFNRIGMIGPVVAPALTYFYVTEEAETAGRAMANPLVIAAQENAMIRTGIPVPGMGYVGEMVRINPRKIEARHEGSEWVVASGPDVIGRFGATDWVAKESARVIREGLFTEFCRISATGPTFFLVEGAAPTRVPFSVQGRRFDPNTLKAQPLGTKWAVTESGRHLFDVTSKEEGEAVVKVLKHYRFDQVCQIGTNPKASMMFLARSH